MRTFNEKTSNILKEKTIKIQGYQHNFFQRFKKYEASGIFVTGSLLKEEAVNIKDL